MQEDTIQHLSDYISQVVEENDLDEFFAASTIEEQRGLLQKVSPGLQEAVLLVNNYTKLVSCEDRTVYVNTVHA